MDDKTAYEILSQAWRLIKKYHVATIENSDELCAELCKLSLMGAGAGDEVAIFSGDIAKAVFCFFENRNDAETKANAS